MFKKHNGSSAYFLLSPNGVKKLAIFSEMRVESKTYVKQNILYIPLQSK